MRFFAEIQGRDNAARLVEELQLTGGPNWTPDRVAALPAKTGAQDRSSWDFPNPLRLQALSIECPRNVHRVPRPSTTRLNSIAA